MTSTTTDMTALARTIVLANDKGGVGKTSITANLAGQAAAAGYRVLALDLNRQANLARDLGYRDTSIDDAGQHLLKAVSFGEPLQPVPDPQRDNLYLVPGGVQLTGLAPMIHSRQHAGGSSGHEAFRALADALAPVAGEYDLVLVDSPPENTTLVDLALAAARWVLLPTRSDNGGIDGIELVADRFVAARRINPHLQLLGVVLFATGTTARAIHRQVQREVTELFGGASPLFATFIRYAERAGVDARDRGRLAHELEVDAANQPAWWEALRERHETGHERPRLGKSSALVSSDYSALAGEILDALAAAETTEMEPTA